MGTYDRPNIYSNINNQDLDFKRLAVVFHQNKSIGDSVNSFEEINNTELLKNVKFSSFYKTTDNFENTIKDITFLNSDDKVLNIISTENAINNNDNIPSSGEISIFNFINTIQYKFKRIDFTGNNLTDVNLNTYLNDSEISVFQINIAIKMSGSTQNTPALTSSIDDLKSNYPKIKYINLFLSNNINGYNGVGSGSTLAHGINGGNVLEIINGGNGQTGGAGGNALEIISTEQTEDADKIKIFIKNASRIIKGYGANGGAGGARGRNSAPVVYNPDYLPPISQTYTLDYGKDATSEDTAHIIVFRASSDNIWRYMAVNSGIGYGFEHAMPGNPTSEAASEWSWFDIPAFTTYKTESERNFTYTHTANGGYKDKSNSFDIKWDRYWDTDEDYGNRRAYLYQIQIVRTTPAVGNPITHAEQAYVAGSNGNNAILYGQSEYNNSIYDSIPDNVEARANTGGANFTTGTSRTNTEGTSGTGGIHGRHGSAIVSSTNILLKKDNEPSYS